MGLLDKAKFWKKDDDFSDLGDLGDFGMGDEMGKGPADMGGDLGPLPPIGGQHEAEGGYPRQREEVQPTQASIDIGNRMGMQHPAPQEEPSQAPRMTQQYGQQFTQSQYAPTPSFRSPTQGMDISDLAKDIEIIHAKLDAIKSSLDAINQRLATLERAAYGEQKRGYNW